MGQKTDIFGRVFVLCVNAYVCVFVCVTERKRERESVHVCEYVSWKVFAVVMIIISYIYSIFSSSIFMQFLFQRVTSPNWYSS